MLINDLMNVQEIFNAWEDIQGDINILFCAIEDALNYEGFLRDEGKSKLSDEDFEKLEELFNALEAIPSTM